MGLPYLFVICGLLGIFTGLTVWLDKAKIPRRVLIMAYTLLAVLVLFADIEANFGTGQAIGDKFLNLVPLLVWSLALEIRAVYLIRKGW